MPISYEELETFLLNFTIAGITAACAKTITAPFDRIKLILQNQSSSLQILTKKRQSYKGLIDCLIRLPKEQGFMSFWRGNGINLIRYFPTQALNFSFNDFFKHRFYKAVGKDSPAKILFVKVLSGSLAGTFSTAIVYPLEFCQTRVTVDIGSDIKKSTQKNNGLLVEREFLGLSDCISKVKRVEGVRGLYRGFLVSILGVSLYRGLYFSLFDIGKRLWAKEHVHSHHDIEKPPFLMAFLLAQIGTCTAGACTYPLDTVGRRLMFEAGRPKELRLFNSTWGAFKAIYTHEGGIKTFYRGIGANCLRGVSGALVLVFYDEVRHYANLTKRTSS